MLSGVMIFTQEVNNNSHKWILILAGVIVLGVLYAIFIIPKMQQILKAERERATLKSLEDIYDAQVKFNSTKGRFATLKELADEGLIKREYATGKSIKGYNFSAFDITAKTFTIHADRDSAGSGFRDFNMLETGVIYYIEKQDITDTVQRWQGTELGY
jgi:Tfp pilus assembly protein PilE